jgi:hypothetical protein
MGPTQVTRGAPLNTSHKCEQREGTGNSATHLSIVSIWRASRRSTSCSACFNVLESGRLAAAILLTAAARFAAASLAASSAGVGGARTTGHTTAFRSASAVMVTFSKLSSAGSSVRVTLMITSARDGMSCIHRRAWMSQYKSEGDTASHQRMASDDKLATVG